MNIIYISIISIVLFIIISLYINILRKEKNINLKFELNNNMNKIYLFNLFLSKKDTHLISNIIIDKDISFEYCDINNKSLYINPSFNIKNKINLFILYHEFRHIQQKTLKLFLNLRIYLLSIILLIIWLILNSILLFNDNILIQFISHFIKIIILIIWLFDLYYEFDANLYAFKKIKTINWLYKVLLFISFIWSYILYYITLLLSLIYTKNLLIFINYITNG